MVKSNIFFKISDLKPENILLSSSSILKIIDFGLGIPYSKNSLLKTACGSPCYASPEMLQGNPYNSLKSDIWSAGIIFYAMICGFLPFEDSDTKVLYEKIKEGKFEIPDFLSADAIKFLNLILVVEPKKRPGIEIIRRDSWFKQFRGEVQDENLYTNGVMDKKNLLFLFILIKIVSKIFFFYFRIIKLCNMIINW